jgi:hypothetical protein
MSDLPHPGTERWVIRRKAEIVAAVRGGLPTPEEACSRYMLTADELLSWQYLTSPGCARRAACGKREISLAESQSTGRVSSSAAGSFHHGGPR